MVLGATVYYMIYSDLFLCLCEQGQDDLRQDAVMQQVFSMCSMLLQRNTDTRKRKLNIRRYKVTHIIYSPLSLYVSFKENNKSALGCSVASFL